MDARTRAAERHPQSAATLNKELLCLRNPALGDYRWPLLEISASEPGPTLCVMSGIHVNEVSGIEASLRLAHTLPAMLVRGKVSILPVVNLPALRSRTEYDCPVDQKNINWSFPGDPAGTFSDQLADALLNEWANEATVLVDMHGGDLRESIATFVMYQQTGTRSLDEQNRRLAGCFDAQFVEPLCPTLMNGSGRACTGRGVQGRMAVMSECGSNGILDPQAVNFHHDGVLRIAHLLGMTEEEPPRNSQEALTVRNRIGLNSPSEGFFRSLIDVPCYVDRGQKVGDIRNYHGDVTAELTAPVTGIALFKITHPVVDKGERIMSFVTPVEPCNTHKEK